MSYTAATVTYQDYLRYAMGPGLTWAEMLIDYSGSGQLAPQRGGER